MRAALFFALAAPAAALTCPTPTTRVPIMLAGAGRPNWLAPFAWSGLEGIDLMTFANDGGYFTYNVVLNSGTTCM